MRRPPTAPPSPLLDVLGAQWTLDVPVVGVAWSGDLAGFGLGDGSLATGRARWEGAPTLSPCEGGTRLTPATVPQPPMARLRVHGGVCLSVDADLSGRFLTGGDDGVLAVTTPDGVMTVVESVPGRWVDHVAAGAAGWSAAAMGRRVRVWNSADTHILELPASATALAFDATGTQLAIAYDHGVTVWTVEAPSRALQTPGCPLSLAWSRDGTYLICGLQENALHGWRLSDGSDIEMGGYPGQPRSLSFSSGTQFLASSGSPLVICWKFDPPGVGGMPLEAGLRNSRQPVCTVAYHPTHQLIAAGYHNGAVLLCQPGSDEVVFVKASTGGSVTALAWSNDGSCLAMGTQGGEAGVVALPDLLFRFSSDTGQPST